MNIMVDVKRVREAIITAIPYGTSSDANATKPGGLYLPRAHVKALRLESSLVIGARGVGKTFWTGALANPSLRGLLGDAVHDLECAHVHVGFAAQMNTPAYPDMDTISNLMKQGCSPYAIWRAVILRWLANAGQNDIPMGSWLQTVEWVEQNPELLVKTISNASASFAARHEKGLIVFDALDRTSNDWRTMDTIVRELLRVVLWLQSFPSLFAKVFLREDQFGRTVTDFPDASKILATRAELTWQPHDQHGLLWQLLCNAEEPHGALLRGIYRDIVGQLPKNTEYVWMMADAVKQSGGSQKKLFDILAGPWMGKDRRRGVPYVWSVSHLADGRGQTSPRSFLAAIRAAAEDSLDRYGAHPYALHYESIKRGVQKASEIRIDEIQEDYPWVGLLSSPLEGLNVPADYSQIEERWKLRFSDGLNTLRGDRLPPLHLESGWAGTVEDLVRLGIFEVMKDGRINMPDLYRVGFGLGRKGGVKPAKR
jgi:hypothetical protein